MGSMYLNTSKSRVFASHKLSGDHGGVAEFIAEYDQSPSKVLVRESQLRVLESEHSVPLWVAYEAMYRIADDSDFRASGNPSREAKSHSRTSKRKYCVTV